jgi:hypothetical protein
MSLATRLFSSTRSNELEVHRRQLWPLLQLNCTASRFGSTGVNSACSVLSAREISALSARGRTFQFTLAQMAGSLAA